VAAQGALGQERASVINRLLDAFGGGFAVFRYVTPDVEDIGLGEGREKVGARRHSSAGRTPLAPVVFHGLNLAASLCAVDKLSALGLLITFLDVRR
jgi:hypothetical protein